MEYIRYMYIFQYIHIFSYVLIGPLASAPSNFGEITCFFFNVTPNMDQMSVPPNASKLLASQCIWSLVLKRSDCHTLRVDFEGTRPFRYGLFLRPSAVQKFKASAHHDLTGNG